MLLPDSMDLRIMVPYNSRSTAFASFDGRSRVELKRGDHVKVSASPFPFLTVEPEELPNSWFHSVSRTLQWNQRQQQKSFVLVEENAPSLSASQTGSTDGFDGVSSRGGSRLGTGTSTGTERDNGMGSGDSTDDTGNCSEAPDEFDIQDGNTESASRLWEELSAGQKNESQSKILNCQPHARGNPTSTQHQEFIAGKNNAPVPPTKTNIKRDTGIPGTAARCSNAPHTENPVTCDAFVVYGRDDSDESSSDIEV